MKQLLKYLVAFFLGAGLALAVASVFLPPTMHVSSVEIGITKSHWTLGDFETINREMSHMPGFGGIAFAVTPASAGYEIHCFDRNLKARFGFANWGEPIRMIHTRMNELRGDSANDWD